MPNKPPAFQFYAKDWLSSSTVRRMSDADKSLYIDLLAAAWDSEIPGTLPLDPHECALAAGRRYRRPIVAFFSRYRRSFVVSATLKRRVNEKLYEQWLEMAKTRETKRLAAKTRWDAEHARALQVQCPASATAFASATAKPLNTTPLPPASAGDVKNISEEISWGGEIVVVENPRHRRLLTQTDISVLAGGRADDLVSLLGRKGFKAHVRRVAN